MKIIFIRLACLRLIFDQTRGDNRISNFMLWQIAYAEIWTTDAYWPAFTPEMFLQAIKEYQGRERRFGGLVTK